MVDIDIDWLGIRPTVNEEEEEEEEEDQSGLQERSYDFQKDCPRKTEFLSLFDYNRLGTDLSKKVVTLSFAMM